MAYKDKIIRNPVTGQCIRFLQTSCDTEGKLLEMESTFAPHSLEPLLHYHPKQHETFTVQEGSLYVRMNGKVNVLMPEAVSEIPANTPHSMWNGSGTKTVVNWKVEPALSTKYFLETGMELAARVRVKNNGLPCLLQNALLAEKYKNVFRLASTSFMVQRVIFKIIPACKCQNVNNCFLYVLQQAFYTTLRHRLRFFPLKTNSAVLWHCGKPGLF